MNQHNAITILSDLQQIHLFYYDDMNKCFYIWNIDTNKFIESDRIDILNLITKYFPGVDTITYNSILTKAAKIIGNPIKELTS